MKTQRIVPTVSFALALGLSAGFALADTVTTSETTTYSGVVSEINPATSTIILKSETSPAPVTYTYTKETAFMDANGNVVTSETVRNSPVRVEYTNTGGQVIVRRVVQTQPGVIVVPSAVVPSAPVIMVPAPAAPVVVAPAPAAVIREKTTTHTESETR